MFGSAAHASARKEATLAAGVSGTTWKKKSRQGSPEVTNVGEAFSVSPFAGCRFSLLKLASSRSRNMSPVAGAAAFAAARRLSAGGPRRVYDTTRRHAAAAAAAIGLRLGFGLGF